MASDAPPRTKVADLGFVLRITAVTASTLPVGIVRWIGHVSPPLTTDDFHRYAFAFTSALAMSLAIALGLLSAPDED